MPNSLLHVENLTKTYRRGGLFTGHPFNAVNNLSFDMPGDKATIVSVVGESGSGKTTLARMILRLIEPTSGSISLNEKINILKKKELPDKEFKRFIQPIFQNPFEAFSNRRKVESYLYATAKNLGNAKNHDEARNVVAEALASVGLDINVVSGKYSSQFSGGELQRISIARALIAKPKIIIADEPVAMVDASMKINIVNLFVELKEKYNISFIYITHDLSTAYYVSDYIAIMYHGDLVEYGSPEQILTNPSNEYTKLLMDAVPTIGEKWEDQIAIL